MGSFDIGGDDLLDDVQVELEGEAFEISVDSLDGYTQTLAIDLLRWKTERYAFMCVSNRK